MKSLVFGIVFCGSFCISPLRRVVSGWLLNKRPFRGCLLLGVPFNGLLFAKDCSSEFPNLGSVELRPCGSWLAFLARSHGKNH